MAEHAETVAGKRILVTGGAGMIGSGLVRRLSEAGADVHVIDNLWRGRIENLMEGSSPIIDIGTRFSNADLRDSRQADALIQGFDTVFHLADVVAGIGFVFDNEFEILSDNLAIDRNVTAACARGSVENLVYAGSACSYPKERQSSLDPPPLREDEIIPASPESAYGWSKLMGEMLALQAERAGLVRVGIARFHNVYGPRADLRPKTSQVIPALIRKAILFPHKPLEVWGSGRQRRSFLFVDDAVETLLRVRQWGLGKGAIQMGAPRSTSIAEIAKLIVALTDTDPGVVFDRTRPEGDIDRMPDLSRARELLDMPRPTTGIEDGIHATFLWAGQVLADAIMDQGGQAQPRSLAS